jgi:hypothetical protein
MTFQDVFIQVLSEESGKPKKEISDLFIAIRSTQPKGKWDNVLSQEESENLLNSLRKVSPGILMWLYEGVAAVEQNFPTTVN